MEDKIIYLPSRYSRTRAPLLKNTLNEYELNVLKVAKEGMFIKKGKVYIAINDGLRVGELIRIGDIPMKYRIVKEAWFTQQGNRCYQIKRWDDTLIQGLDLTNAKSGAKVIVVGRKSDSYYLKMI